jgi:hypothetical protein
LAAGTYGEISRYPVTIAKVLVTIDDWLLERIDKEARHRGVSRSAYLSELARREVEAHPGPGRRTSARRAVAQLDRLFGDHPQGDDATIVVRSERDSY